MKPYQLRAGAKRYDPMNPPKTKRCATCKAEKDLKEFNKCRNNHDGKYSDCRECQNKKHNEAKAKKKVDKSKYFDF